MIHESTRIDLFKSLFSLRLPISISGESGTGKTTLALYLVGNILTFNDKCRGSCIWIQAGEIFPIKRLSQMFESHLEYLQYLKESILVTPQDHIIHTYEEQYSILHSIISPSAILPPDLRFIVIDNISHHLRYKLTHFNNISDITNLLDVFYEDQILPLLLFCKRSKIGLILIHEVTYNPKSSQLRPFFFKLFDRIETIDIVLSNSYKRLEKKIKISSMEFTKSFTFSIEQEGISIG